MKILLPVDGSATSDAAVAFVAARPPIDGGHPQIDLLNVQLPIPPRAGRAVGADVVRAWHEAEAARVLKPAIARLQQADLEPAWFHRVGHPGLVIADWAETHGIDLIVMGSHGRTALKNVLFGSVTQAVLASTTVPVLVLRTPRAPTRASLRVGLALDGSAYGAAVADYVLAHRSLFGPRPVFMLIHAVESPDSARRAVRGEVAPVPTAVDLARIERAAFERVVAPIRRRFGAAGIDVQEKFAVGPAAAEIVRAAAGERLDILVMGSHGRGAFTSALLGSVAWRVAANCGTPLLLIRPKS
jgi:nucleotide-binding universal stress UspA family protein